MSEADSRFEADKAKVLKQVDLSRKGSVDAAIAPLLVYINAQECYYSTSSCAGRLIVFAEEKEQRKKGCQWLLVSHDPVEPSQLESALHSGLPESGYVYFKFEPFVLHVMCATLQDARLMVLPSGCRLQLAPGSATLAYPAVKERDGWLQPVRSTHSLEAPLACNGTVITSPEYCKHLVDIGNNKLKDNLDRVQRFFQRLKEAMDERERCVCTNSRGRKREAQSRCPRPNPGQTSDLPHEEELPELEEGDFTTLFAGDCTEPYHS